MRARWIAAVLGRELRGLARELRAFPDEASLWATPAGVRNSAGTLALHLCGNLDHFVGALLGQTGYRRDRDHEFAARGLPRADLVQRIEATAATVETTLASLSDERLDEPFPGSHAGCRLHVGDFLIHLASHLAYHLGQVDYHRRVVTGSDATVRAIAIPELASATPG